MSNFTIRQYEKNDIPALSEIWQQVFGDSREFISEFFRLLPEMGTGVLAVCENEIAGAAYVLWGQSALISGKTLPAAYIYAVATLPRFRHMGIGEAVTKAAAEAGRRNGAEIISTLPAEASLYGWYEKIIGTGHVLRRKKEIIPARKGAELRALSAGEYLKRREELLASQPHLILSEPALELERAVCADSFGGLYTLGESLCAAYREDKRAVIPELICSGGESRSKSAAEIASALGAEEALFFTPHGEGEDHIALNTEKIPIDFLWNLAFD